MLRDNYPTGLTDGDDEFWQDAQGDETEDEPERDTYDDQHDRD